MKWLKLFFLTAGLFVVCANAQAAIVWENQDQLEYQVIINGGVTADISSLAWNPSAYGAPGIKANVEGLSDPITSTVTSYFVDPVVHVVLDAGASGRVLSDGAFAKAYAMADLSPMTATQALMVEQRVLSLVTRRFSVTSPGYYDLNAALARAINFSSLGNLDGNPHAVASYAGGAWLTEYRVVNGRLTPVREWFVSLDTLLTGPQTIANVYLRYGDRQ